MKTRHLLLATAIAAAQPAAAQIDTASTVVIVAGQDAALAYNQGLTDIGQWRLAKAARDFSDAIAYTPKFAKAYHNRGVVELSTFDNTSALNDFTQAHALNPANRNAQAGMAIALARQGKYDEALEAMQNAEAQGISRQTYTYYTGYINYLKGDYQQAQDNYSEAIKTSPNDHRPYCDRATALLKDNKPKDALADYNTAINLSPKSTYLYIMRADAKAAQGNYNLALQDINTAIQLAGEDCYDELNARGVMYGRSGRYKKAMADFDACLAMKPDRPDTHINIGNMLMSQKKYAEAEQQYTKAITLDPNNMAAYNNRANAREMQFDLDGAQEDIETYNKLKTR